ncbi:MAG: flagellin [Spirochaetota bacterium]|nr:flagellin [Spirochaetota bacterium]
MIINHNISAIAAHRYLKINTNNIQDNIRKLSSGLRITRGGDDASGLAVSEKMRSQIRGLHQASRNAQDGISMLQTAEGWLAETSSILHRMRELAVQSSNGIYTTEDREQIKVEIEQLVDEIDRISSQAEFNTLKVLRGGFRGDEATAKGEGTKDRTAIIEQNRKTADPKAVPVERGATSDSDPHPLVRNEGDDKGGIYFHIGANVDQREKVYIGNISATALGLAKGPVDAKGAQRELMVSYLSQDGANRSIQKIDSALYVVSKQRADLGAYQNRLEHTIRGVDIAAENLQSAESKIRDLDMASEMVDFVKNQILSQATSSMLAQANLRPQVILRVLG